MRLKYSSRQGNFNLLSPSEKSISCHILILDDENNPIKSTSVHTEHFEEGDDIGIAISLIEEYDRKVISSAHEEWRDIIKFLKENKDEIEKGNKEYKIIDLKRKIENLQSELESLTK